MLDEKKEYEEYTIPLDADSIPRLKPDCFVSKVSKKKKTRSTLLGLHRSLTIIARYFLFDEFHYEKTITPEEQISILEQVTKILEAWCGFMPIGQKSSYAFENWLTTYYQRFITEQNLGEGLPLWEEIKSEKSVQFTYKIFPYKVSASSSNGKNTIKAISYERVIAQAVEDGPLYTYFLTCKKDFAGKVIFKTETKEKSLSVNAKKAKEYRDLVLKLIAVYLIEKKKTGNDYIVVNLTSFSHWVQQKTDSKKMSIFFYDCNHLFEFLVVNGNTLKMRVHPEYLKDYDFKITTEKATDLPDGYVLFEDQGSGKPLNCI